jgi:2-polyprenyl-6-methoxyphenol hydroxylase-like FAD-dependent oxidoreductase
MAHTAHTRTQVLIVGAGPVGLAAAIELGMRGIRCMVVERNDRVGYAPRAKTTNVRTREHLRRWGIADRLRDASPLGVDYPTDVFFVTRLSGHLLAKFENAFYGRPERNPLYSEHAQWIPQYTVEEILRAHAESLPGVTVHFSRELVSFEQDAGEVRARVRDLAGSGDTTVTSDFLIGADGSRSTVRQLIGARMQGVRGLSRNYNVVFRAPGLAAAHRHGPGIMYWQVNAEVPSLLGPMDRGDQWFFAPTQVPEGVRLADFEAPDLIRKATGIDVPIEILSSDEWLASRLIADRYRDRRVFLAGDACHLHPPFGGYGMNMGVADGVDLGWKMAAVLQGWGGGGLLDAYEQERRPVHNFVMDEAVANHSVLSNQLVRPGLEDVGTEGERLRATLGAEIQATKAREFHTLGVVLGYRYQDSPIIVPDGSAPPAAHYRDYRPSAHPGCLAPHAWLADGSSLYDHFGQGYALVVATAADKDGVAGFVAGAARAEVPLCVVDHGDREVDDLYQARYTVIRPDQHVAWRGDTLPPATDALFRRITGRAV